MAEPLISDEATVTAVRTFTLRQRCSISLISWAGYLAIRIICPTLRWQISSEGGETLDDVRQPVIGVFWHRCVFMAAHFFRKRMIAVMTSRSFDGEYIARIIEKLGYTAVRGSSSRGGARGLLEMHEQLKLGSFAAFTIDGPRGPKYVAKPGPVLLARNSQAPIYALYIAVDRAWVLNSWDNFVIPKPFARAVVRASVTIRVPADATSADMERYHAEMQAALDRTRETAEELAGVAH